MEKRQFGNTNMQVSVLGFGGAEIGFAEADESTVETLLHGALDTGLNVIDTGECYRDSEELTGETQPRRGEYYLFTKGWPSAWHGKSRNDKVAPRGAFAGLRYPESMMAAETCEAFASP
jgi:aryl-alcohol dehydrogenase-like predicted oxidoreductase